MDKLGNALNKILFVPSDGSGQTKMIDNTNSNRTILDNPDLMNRILSKNSIWATDNNSDVETTGPYGTGKPLWFYEQGKSIQDES